MSSNSKIISKGFALAETLVRDAIIKKMMEAGPGVGFTCARK